MIWINLADINFIHVIHADIYFNLTENLNEKTAEKLPTESIKETKEAEFDSKVQKEASIMNLKSVHIEEEQLGIENKTSESSESNSFRMFNIQ